MFPFINVLKEEKKVEYEISDTPLGEGAYGSVFKAFNTTTKTPVAIKICEKTNKEAVAQIRQEKKMLKLCNHSHIIGLKDYYETED